MIRYFYTRMNHMPSPLFTCDPVYLFNVTTGELLRRIPPGVKWDPNITAIVREWAVLNWRIPLDGTVTIEELQDYIKLSTITTNGHEHTYTCKKGKIGRRGDHYDCRMDMDLTLVVATCLLADVTFVVRRDMGMLPSFIPGLQLAYPANHVMQLNCEGSRFLRRTLLHDDAQKVSDTKVRMFPDELCTYIKHQFRVPLFPAMPQSSYIYINRIR